MEKNYTDELYEILDEMNARIEEIVNGHNDPEAHELINSILEQKCHEFVDDFEHEIEKLELAEVSF
ncbi:hypothetical protein ACFL5B_03350 [Candidatus Latescibacterota bacterium]